MRWECDVGKIEFTCAAPVAAFIAMYQPMLIVDGSGEEGLVAFGAFVGPFAGVALANVVV